MFQCGARANEIKRYCKTNCTRRGCIVDSSHLHVTNSYIWDSYMYFVLQDLAIMWEPPGGKNSPAFLIKALATVQFVVVKFLLKDVD